MRRWGTLVVVMVAFGMLILGRGRVGAQPQLAAFDPAPYVGVYEGSWTNQTTGASGPTRMEIAVDATTSTVRVTLDFDGPYLGLDNPPPTTLSGHYDEAGARLS